MKTGNSKNESPPLSHLYGLVCGFYNWSKETAPALLPAPVWPFLRSI